MLCCAILYRAILYCAVLHCIALSCPVMLCSALLCLMTADRERAASRVASDPPFTLSWPPSDVKHLFQCPFLAQLNYNTNAYSCNILMCIPFHFLFLCPSGGLLALSRSVFSGEVEKGLAELANCRIQVANLETSLKEQQEKVADIQKERPREALETPGTGSEKKSVGSRTEGAVAGGTPSLDDAGKTAEIQRLRVRLLCLGFFFGGMRWQYSLVGASAAGSRQSSLKMAEILRLSVRFLVSISTFLQMRVALKVCWSEKLEGASGFQGIELLFTFLLLSPLSLLPPPFPPSSSFPLPFPPSSSFLLLPPPSPSACPLPLAQAV